MFVYISGAYDPRVPEGWKADPKSAFVGDGRFKASQEVSEGEKVRLTGIQTLGIHAVWFCNGL